MKYLPTSRMWALAHLDCLTDQTRALLSPVYLIAALGNSIQMIVSSAFHIMTQQDIICHNTIVEFTSVLRNWQYIICCLSLICL